CFGNGCLLDRQRITSPEFIEPIFFGVIETLFAHRLVVRLKFFKKGGTFRRERLKIYFLLLEEFLKGHVQKYDFAVYFSASRRLGGPYRKPVSSSSPDGLRYRQCFPARNRRFPAWDHFPGS